MSGWTNQDITYLVIPTGATSGKRVVIANPDTGDAVDVYDTAGDLVATITADGVIMSIFPGGNDSFLRDGVVTCEDVTGLQSATFQIIDAPNNSTGTGGQIYVNNPGPFSAGILTVFSDSEDGTQKNTVEAFERHVLGSVVVSDNRSVNNLFHAGAYSCATNASGIGTFSHGCGFTPTGGVMVAYAAVAAGATQFSIQNGSWTSSQVTIAVKTPAGAAYNGTATFYAIFWG
jgi:hypothetical protein